jgi:hypothetical protein
MKCILLCHLLTVSFSFFPDYTLVFFWSPMGRRNKLVLMCTYIQETVYISCTHHVFKFIITKLKLFLTSTYITLAWRFTHSPHTKAYKYDSDSYPIAIKNHDSESNCLQSNIFQKLRIFRSSFPWNSSPYIFCHLH